MTSNYPRRTEEWLAKLISFDTTSRNSNLVLIDYIQRYLRSVGVAATLVYNHEKTKANLFATLPGAAGATQGGIVLSGHTDVVPVDGQQWHSDPFVMVERDGKLYGRGACDMKGFLAVVLALTPTFLAMRRVAPVHYAFTYDEEVGCVGVAVLAAFLRESGFKADACLVGDGQCRIVTGSKGFRSWTVEVHGKAIHSSLALMGTSCNAIEHAAVIIRKIREIAEELRASGSRDEHYTCPFSCMSVGVIRGGNAVNTVPASCAFDFSLRVTDTAVIHHVEQRIQAFITDVVEPAMRREDAAAHVKLTPAWSAPAFNARETAELTQLARRLLGDREICKMGGATESGYFEEFLGIPTVIAGVGGSNAHLADEYTERRLLAKSTHFTNELVEHCTCIGPGTRRAKL